MILALNAVRNEVAHYGNEEKRAAKIARLREVMSRPARANLEGAIKKANDEKLVTYAALMGGGFLLTTIDEVKKARGLPIEEE